MAVNDMNLDNGCLEVVPGSHKEEIPLGSNMVSCFDDVHLTAVHRHRLGSQADVDTCPLQSWHSAGLWLVPRPPLWTKLQLSTSRSDLCNLQRHLRRR